MSIPERIVRGHQAGLTFVELVMFIVIVGVGVAGILLVLTITTRSSSDPQLRKQALAIAEALMEEVQGSRFTFCDPSDPAAETATSTAGCTVRVENVGVDAGEARPFDNVNDYVTAYGTPVTYATDATGQALPSGYSATITVTAEALNGIASDGSAPATTNVLRIRVAVNFGADQIVLDAYRTRYAPTWIP